MIYIWRFLPEANGLPPVEGETFSMANDSVAVVVDHNVVDRRSIVSILRKEFNVNNIYQSGTARDALTVIKNEPQIEWVFSDTDLPDLDGFEFLSRARTFPSTASSSFIMMSSRRDKESLLMAATAGVTDYVVKPFTSSVVVAKLRKIANGHERRESKRIQVSTDYELDVNFGSSKYAATLLDISLGGCQIRSELLKNGGGCIYDVANLVIKSAHGDLALEAKMVRTEVDHENPEETTMKAAFRFQNTDQKRLDGISKLISSLKEGAK